MNRSVLRGIVLIGLAVVIIGCLILMPGAKPKPVHPANNDPWLLVSYDPNNPYGTYLGNGFISTRVMADGVGKECYMAGLYDDEKLVQTPNWADLRFYDGATQFKIDKDAPYKQTLDMKTGIVTTEATWRAGDKTLTGKIEVIVSRAMPNVAMIRAELVPDFTGAIECLSNLQSTESLKLSAPEDSGLSRKSDEVTRPVRSCVAVSNHKAGIGLALCIDSSELAIGREGLQRNAQNYAFNAMPRKSFWVSAYASVANPPDSKDGRWPEGVALEALKAAFEDQHFIDSHKAAMAKLWQKDIIIDGPVQDQQAIHSCMFYLMQSVREGSQWSIPPMGLSNNAFSGHVFWDADLWMFPALILQRPELAKSIVDYRYNTLSGAMANAKVDGFAGAQYAWESGASGKEDTPPGLVYRHERHINGDIALAQWQYFLATNDLKWLKTRGYPVLKATADWWVSKAKFVKEKNRYEILQVVPPDENAELVNNSAYTNAIAQLNLKIAMQAAKLTGSAANPNWAEVASKLYIPYDAANKRFIAHDAYKGYVAKQADNELLAYPLQVVIPGVDMNEVYKSNFDFYSAKVHENGPAMTSSAYSVIAARLGDRDRAYSEFVKSYKPFLRGPFNLFNEKPSKTVDNMCFLTGAAGPIQSIMFGLAGARMDYFPADYAKADLQFKPCLPKAWKSLKITGLQWRGKTFDVTIDSANKATIHPK